MTILMQDVMLYGGGECLQQFGVPFWRVSRGQDVPATMTRSGSVGSFIGKDGILRSASADRLRIEWVNGVPLFVLEAGRTTLILRSEDLATLWANANSTDASDTTLAPDGKLTADTLIEDATAGDVHEIGQDVAKAASSLIYAASVHVKAKERSGVRLRISDAVSANGVFVDVPDITGAAGSATAFGSGWTADTAGIQRLGDSDWYRVFVIGTSDSSTTVRLTVGLHDGVSAIYDGDGASGLFVWGSQLEQVSRMTSYMGPTLGSAASRALETLFTTYFDRPQEMSMYVKIVEGGTVGIISGGVVIQLSDSVGSDPRLFIADDGAGKYRAVHGVGGSAVVSTVSNTPLLGQTVELFLDLGPDGSVALTQIADGGSPDIGATSGALALAGQWSDRRLNINSVGVLAAGVNRFAAIKMVRGAGRSRADMRALFAVPSG